jgi:hypothetical protein
MSVDSPPAAPGSASEARLEPFTGSHRPMFELVRINDGWRKTSYLTSADATSLRIVIFHGDTEPIGTTAIEDLADWTGLSTERLAYALGASRRSLYNWRHGTQVRPDVQERISQIYRLLKAVLAWWPGGVGSWLERGDPPAIDLMHRGEWEQLRERLEQSTAPPIARRPGNHEPEGAPEAFAPRTHALALSTFAAPAGSAPARAGWRPRELTGLGEWEVDDE